MENMPDTLQKTQDKASTFGLREVTRNNYARGGRIDARDVISKLQAGGTASNPIVVEQRFVQLSPEERKKRMEENRCFHCNEQGHRAARCPKKQRRFNGNRNFNNQPNQGSSNSNWRNNYSNNNKSVNARTATIAEQFTELIGKANDEDLNEMHLQIVDAKTNEPDFQGDD
jgi:hypothetical protein